MGLFRLLLALSVVVSHFGGVWGHRYMDGSMAVRCFFMVSGFLMALILSGKYNTRTWSGLKLFYSNRALRIFVAYWSFLLLTLASFWLASAWTGQLLWPSWHETTLATRAYLLFTNILVLGQEWAMWLSYDQGSLTLSLTSSLGAHPHPTDFHLIPQAWSISLELMFYGLAPFLVRRHSAILVCYIAAAYLLRYYLNGLGLTHSGFNFRFFPVELLFFLAGVLSYRAYSIAKDYGLMSAPLSIAITAALIAMLFVMRYWTFWESQQFYILVAIALPFLFDFSRRFSFDAWLGELSYPIYLCHLAVLTLGNLVVKQMGISPDGLLTVVLIAATVSVAILYVRLVDAPFERWRQSRAIAARMEARIHGLT